MINARASSKPKSTGSHGLGSSPVPPSITSQKRVCMALPPGPAVACIPTLTADEPPLRRPPDWIGSEPTTQGGRNRSGSRFADERQNGRPQRDTRDIR